MFFLSLLIKQFYFRIQSKGLVLKTVFSIFQVFCKTLFFLTNFDTRHTVGRNREADIMQCS